MTAFVDIARPSSKSFGITYDILCVLGASLFLALLSQFEFRLWFTPVPITLQTLGVMLIGASLGSKRGALSILAYLAEGALGLPVFRGGTCGVQCLFGPTGGYLLAFVMSAFVVGLLLERGWKENYTKTCVALSLGTLLTLGGGALWLSLFVGLPNAFALGVAPFLVGAAVKILIAATLISSGWKGLRFLGR